MDISAGKYKSDTNPIAHHFSLLNTVSGMIRRLIGFFKLTKEDQLKAGISVGSEVHDQ
jgi:hypothetical protein